MSSWRKEPTGNDELSARSRYREVLKTSNVEIGRQLNLDQRVEEVQKR